VNENSELLDGPYNVVRREMILYVDQSYMHSSATSTIN